MDRGQEIAAKLVHFWNELNDHDANLLAVSKTKPVSDIQLAYEASQRDFGENKVQDLLDKATELEKTCPDIRWHFIGHLQSNKMNMLFKTPGLVAIHSIDSLKLLKKILNKVPLQRIGLFLQVNTSQETEKSGFTEISELEEAIELILKSENFFLQGLMTIGRIRTENFEADALECFEYLGKLKKDFMQKFDLKDLELSMGMTADFAIALKSGAKWIRIGSAIFGERA
jgi:pyridoxal phosphate enzyme (YggS family)